MLKIGEFSKISRVNIRMLRHYDDIGLLKPVSIDRFTGYRYYSPEQLPVIGRITALKDMGFALADIVKILDVYEDREALYKYFVKRQDELKEIAMTAEYQDDEYKEEDVELIAWKTVKGEYPDTEHVKFKTLPSVKVASCMVRGSYEQMPDVHGAVISWVSANGYECAGPMFNIYHVSPHETQNPDEFVTEVCYPVK